jgi:hypothetical protein
MSDVPQTRNSGDDESEGNAFDEAPLSDEEGCSVIEIDGFKIKARIHPVDPGEPKPKSWSEVRDAVHAKLMSITVNIFGLADDALSAGRTMIIGLAAIPVALARRIGRAHEKADRGEGIKQTKAETTGIPQLSSSRAIDSLEAFLATLQASGVPVEIRELEDGRPAVVIVKPEDRHLALELMRKALPGPAEIREKSEAAKSTADPEPGGAALPEPKKRAQRRKRRT